MKYLLIFSFIHMVTSKSVTQHFLPHLPVGEYKAYSRSISKCKQMEGHIFDFNFYLYKVSSNASEIRGNITFKEEFNDLFNIGLHMAKKDSLGGWKDNAYSYRSNKACKTLKMLAAGSAWDMATNNFGFTRECPWSPGVYVSKGLDFTSFISKLKEPKQVFYGTYKFRFEILDTRNKQVGCIYIIVEAKRPWETEI